MKNKIILALILIFGLSLRLYGYDWGSPLQLHPDEPVIVDQAYDLIKRNSWEPLKYYGTPDQLSIYSLSIVYRIISPIKYYGQSAVATFPYKQSFYYETGRVLTAMVGTLTILIVYLIGIEFSPLVGILNAILFSIFPLFVLHSHYVTPDIPITFLTTLVILCLIKYINTKNFNFLIISTIISALSVIEKYPAVANFGMVGLVYLLINRQNLKKLFINGIKLIIIFLVTLIISAPYLFFKYKRTIEWLILESRSVHPGVQILGFYGNMKYYYNDFYVNGGLIISILSIIGLILIIKSKKLVYIPLLSGFVYWIGLSKIPLHWSRWGLPMYITPLFISAIAIDYLYKKYTKTWIKYLIFVLLFISLLSQIMLNKLNLQKLVAKDTRVVALEYLRDNGINKNNSLYERYTYFFGSSGNIKYNLNELTDNRYKYLILFSTQYNRYLNQSKDGQYKKVIEFYNVAAKNKLLMTFKSNCPVTMYKSSIVEITNIFSTVENGCITGSVLKIYKLK